VSNEIVSQGHRGKVAFVTGAARGIGFEIARVMAHDGADVVMVDMLEQVAESANAITEETGRKALGIVGDVTDEAAVQAAFQQARDALGPVLILINNAAITDNVARVVSMPVSDFARDLEVNLTGTFTCIRHALPGMLEAEWGRIVNISSGAAELGSFGQAGYAASKAGILGLTRSVALEYARKGVTCNALLPGLIDAPAAAGIRGDMRERIASLIPTRRLGTPAEVAYAASWLASSRASYINGASLFVSSGQELFVF
jgi:NAD(P)-dependent dehydrogenase (short-subunit alcohol dehydrogenase family)